MPGPVIPYTGEKGQKGTIKRLAKLLKPMAFGMTFAVLSVTVAAVLQILAPVVLNNILSADNLASFTTIDPDTGLIKVKLLELVLQFGLIFLLYIGMTVFDFISQFMVAKYTGVLTYRLRRDIKDKLDRLPLEYFDNNSNGDVISRVSNDTDTIATAVQQILTQLFKAIVLLIGTSIAMLVLNWQCGLVAIATLPLSILVALFIGKFSQPKFVAQQRLLGSVNGQIEESYSGFKVLKLFNKEKDIEKRFDKESRNLADAGFKAFVLSSMMMPTMIFIHNIAYVAICVLAGFMNSPETIVVFFIFLNIFQQPIQQIAQLASSIQQTVAAADRVFAVLDAADQTPDKENAVVATEEIRGQIDFDDVSFCYNPDVPLIENLDLHVAPGDSIAIVGPTGAGKTTLVNLIMRFYEVTGGSLKIDRIDIRDYERSSIRSQIGMVLQDTWLYNGTIADNIAYGKVGASREEIIAASKEAHAHHFIMTLENGYDTIMNEEGSNVSQGQKQLITIARAILSNPRILILDEATSSVDTRTEKALQDAMTNMMKDRTTFVIAHRLSTIKNAKLILVMNKGHIIERGNHKELLKKGGFYADLYNTQFMGSKENVEETETNS